jgi:hypothetical protein
MAKICGYAAKEILSQPSLLAAAMLVPSHWYTDPPKAAPRGKNINIAGTGGLGPIALRANDTFVLRCCANSRRQYTRHGQQLTIEREFTQRYKPIDRIGRNHAQCHKHAKSNQHIEMRAFFLHIGGGKVDEDALACSCTPMLASAARTRSRDSATALSGRPGMVNAGSPAPKYLHLDRQRFNSLKCDCVNASNHKTPSANGEYDES